MVEVEDRGGQEDGEGEKSAGDEKENRGRSPSRGLENFGLILPSFSLPVSFWPHRQNKDVGFGLGNFHICPRFS